MPRIKGVGAPETTRGELTGLSVTPRRAACRSDVDAVEFEYDAGYKVGFDFERDTLAPG